MFGGNVRDLHKFLESLGGARDNWTTSKIQVKSLEISVHHLNCVDMGIFKAMYANPDINEHIIIDSYIQFDEFGNRVIDELMSASWATKLQVYLELGYKLILFGAYCDKSNITNHFNVRVYVINV